MTIDHVIAYARRVSERIDNYSQIDRGGGGFIRGSGYKSPHSGNTVCTLSTDIINRELASLGANVT